MTNKIITAALIIIGDEILSGRTQDKNINYIASALGNIGIQLMEVRIIPDNIEKIIYTIKEIQKEYNYIFTTGGIGPTHDDMTSEAIAVALNKKLIIHPEAFEILSNHYKDELNEARKKMAYMPEGAELIYNPVSQAPGFIIENIYVMAGVPKIMQAMLDNIINVSLQKGEKKLSKSISTNITEGKLGRELGEIQKNNPEIQIGSYPFMKPNMLGTSIVCRGYDINNIDKIINEIIDLVKKYDGEIFMEDGNI